MKYAIIIEVRKQTTDEFQGMKPRYMPDFREPYLYTLCYTPFYIPVELW